jgi:hypothetical protein
LLEGQRELFGALHATPAAVVLSGYHSPPLYDRLYQDWWRTEMPVTVHSTNGAVSGQAPRVEVIWSNRDLDDGRLAFDLPAPRVMTTGG